MIEDIFLLTLTVTYDLGPQSLAYTVYMRIMKVKGQAGQQLKWKQTDGEIDIQTDRQKGVIFIIFFANAVGSETVKLTINIFLGYRLMHGPKVCFRVL